MNLKSYLVIVALCLISFSIGKYSGPTSSSSVETEHSQTDTKQDVIKNQDVVETTTETRKPDGTVVIEKRKENETTTQTKSETVSEVDKTVSKTSDSRPAYRLGGSYEPRVKGFQESTYSVTIEKHIISELYVGLMGSSRRTVGVSLSLGF